MLLIIKYSTRNTLLFYNYYFIIIRCYNVIIIITWAVWFFFLCDDEGQRGMTRDEVGFRRDIVRYVRLVLVNHKKVNLYKFTVRVWNNFYFFFFLNVQNIFKNV